MGEVQRVSFSSTTPVCLVALLTTSTRFLYHFRRRCSQAKRAADCAAYVRRLDFAMLSNRIPLFCSRLFIPFIQMCLRNLSKNFTRVLIINQVFCCCMRDASKICDQRGCCCCCWALALLSSCASKSARENAAAPTGRVADCACTGELCACDPQAGAGAVAATGGGEERGGKPARCAEVPPVARGC